MYAGGRFVNSQLVPVSSPLLLEQNFLKGVSLLLFASRQQQIALMKARNTWQQALLWLIACDARRVSACDAQLASYMQMPW